MANLQWHRMTLTENLFLHKLFISINDFIINAERAIMEELESLEAVLKRIGIPSNFAQYIREGIAVRTVSKKK